MQKTHKRNILSNVNQWKKGIFLYFVVPLAVCDIPGSEIEMVIIYRIILVASMSVSHISLSRNFSFTMDIDVQECLMRSPDINPLEQLCDLLRRRADPSDIHSTISKTWPPSSYKNGTWKLSCMRCWISSSTEGKSIWNKKKSPHHYRLWTVRQEHLKIWSCKVYAVHRPDLSTPKNTCIYVGMFGI